MIPLALAFLLLAAPPGDAVQTIELGRLSWQRAKALEGRRVCVRFTVYRILPPRDTVVVLVAGSGPELRFVRLTQRDLAPLANDARLTAEGVIRVTWRPDLPGGSGLFIVALEYARLVK